MDVRGRGGSQIATLGAAWREFADKRGPRVIATAVALASAARLALATPGWRDAGAAAFIVIVYPFGEWAIHVHLLHLRPFNFRGREIELATARAHRAHHENPRSLDLINFSPLEALAVLLLAVPAAAGLAAAAVALVTTPLGAGGRIS